MIKINLNKFSVKIFSLSFIVTLLFLFTTYSIVVVKNKCNYLPTNFYKIKMTEQSPRFEKINTFAKIEQKVVPVFFPKIYFAQQIVYIVENALK